MFNRFNEVVTIGILVSLMIALLFVPAFMYDRLLGSPASKKKMLLNSELVNILAAE